MRWRLLVSAGIAATALLALGPSAQVLPALYVAVVLPELWRTDVREHRLPNALTLPGIGYGMLVAVARLAVGEPAATTLIGAACWAGLLLLCALAGGLGMGDVKLAALLGLASPTPLLAIGAPLAGMLLGGMIAIVQLVRGRGDEAMPFGPAMLAGWTAAVVAVLAGDLWPPLLGVAA